MKKSEMRGTLKKTEVTNIDFAKEIFIEELKINGGLTGPALDKCGAIWSQYTNLRHRDPVRSLGCFHSGCRGCKGRGASFYE